jgi:hypothetical protein
MINMKKTLKGLFIGGSLCWAIVLLGFAEKALAFDCHLTCSRGVSCNVQRENGPKITLSNSSYLLEKNCHELRVTSKVNVVISYRRKGGVLFEPREGFAEDTRFADIMKNFPPDLCSVPTSKCLQDRMNLRDAKGILGGRGIDSQVSNPAGTNDPCAFGLPCGAVLPPKGNWDFLVDPPVSGQWQISILRGTPPPGISATFTVPVSQGRFVLSEANLSPSAVYSYQLLTSSNALVVQGEFEVVSRSRLNILQRLATERIENGMGEGAAWLSVLLGGGFDWDFLQLSRK